MPETPKPVKPAAHASSPNKPAPITATELLDTLTPDQLRSLLADELVYNDRLAYRIVSRFGELDAAEASRRFKAEARLLVSDYSRKGFIDWRASLDFEHEWYDLVDRTVSPFLDRNDACGAFDLSCTAFLQLQKVCIDDSNGFFTEATDQCRRFWDKILKDADDKLARHMLSWFLKTAGMPDQPKGDKACIAWLLKDVADEFVTKNFASKPAFAQVVQDNLDKRIEELPEKAENESKTVSASSSSPEDIYRRAYLRGLERLVVPRLETMQVLGCSVEEVRAYAGNYLSAHAVRDWLIDSAEAAGDDAYALTLLEAARKAAKKAGQEAERRAREADSRKKGRSAWWVPRNPAIARRNAEQDIFTWSDLERLYHLHVKVGDHEAAMADLMELAAHGSSLKWWRELRSNVPESRWPVLRASLLAKTPDYARSQLYIEEGMGDELLKVIQEQSRRDQLLGIPIPDGKGFDLLAKTHPRELLDIMRGTCDSRTRSTNRKTYQDIAREMKRMEKVPGGKEYAQAMRADYEKKFPNRLAMREEFAAILD